MTSVLSRDEEVSLARRIAAGDKTAEDELVTRNLPLVGKIAKKFLDQGLDLCDLIQEGSIGLILAARRFDPERKTRFSTYAGLLIHQHLVKAVSRVRPTRQLSDRQAALIPSRDDLAEDLAEDRSRALSVAIETVLDDEERTMVSLSCKGKSQARISVVTGRSRASVGRVHRKAMAKLRRHCSGAAGPAAA